MRSNLERGILLCVCVSVLVLWMRTYLRLTHEITTRVNMEKSHTALRKQLGSLSCKYTGIGPTGGFCLSKNHSKVGGNHRFCPMIAGEFRRLFNGRSVYDFGAGLGWYGKELVKKGEDGFKVTDYAGFDGAENIEDIFPDGFIKYIDLSQPFNLARKDWVLSLEVGEHIPPQYENNFIQNLHRHNKRGVVLSWAVSGQQGHFHVNNHDNSYVKNIFAKLGYVNDIRTEQKLRNITTLSWFKRTIMVFRR